MQPFQKRVLLFGFITLILCAIAYRSVSLQNNPSAPLLGGSFTLTDTHGAVFNSAQLKGRYALIFFGFSHCPDICPVALSTMTEALNALPGNVEKEVQPVFITVDPERDTPEVLAEYKKHFHPALIALTGTPEQVHSVAEQFKAYYEASTPQNGEYSVSHSGYMYLMGKDGEFLKLFSHGIGSSDLASGLEAAIKD